jgi:hypothetical protein
MASGTVLLPAIAVAIVATVLLLTWMSLAGLLVARVLTGWRSARSRPPPRRS